MPWNKKTAGRIANSEQDPPTPPRDQGNTNNSIMMSVLETEIEHKISGDKIIEGTEEK